MCNIWKFVTSQLRHYSDILYPELLFSMEYFMETMENCPAMSTAVSWSLSLFIIEWYIRSSDISIFLCFLVTLRVMDFPIQFFLPLLHKLAYAVNKIY